MRPAPGAVALLLAAGLLTAVSVPGCRGVERRDTASVEAAASSATVPVGPLPGPAVVSLPENPFEGDPVAREEGRRLFVRFNCSGCHGGHGGGGMGPSLRDPVWIYGSSAARIHASIADGRAYGMPAWGPMLPDEYIWKMTAYIQSLGTPDEAQPPR